MHPLAIDAHDHIAGPKTAAVTLLEYGDFGCPYCVAAFPVLEAVRATHGTSLRCVFRHVARGGTFEKQAAEASEFAAGKERFWEMIRELFTHPGAHELDDLVGYAVVIGLDPDECRAALVERRFAQAVRAQAASAARSGIIATPTLFLNGVRFEDRIETKVLGAAIDALAGAC